jgi:hypothetical protein
MPLGVVISLTLRRVCVMGDTEGDTTPEGCDCCGRDAEDCRMAEDGWVRGSLFFATPGVFCRRCAHLLRLVRVQETCVWCDASMAEEESAEAQGWVYYADNLGNLHPCCPSCLAGRFGITDRVSHSRG